VTVRHIAYAVGTATVAVWAMQVAPIPAAHGAPCPDAKVVFARGTTEPPGLGGTGDAFVNALRTQVGGKSVDVYAVDYPATTDFPTAVYGIADARTHVLSTVANCPRTKMVLGGFSQGAAVMGFVTADVVPDGVTAPDVPVPMPPEVASHVAAVVLFGKPSTRFMNAIREPDITIGPEYVAKTIDLCVPNDLVCTSDGRSFDAHTQYVQSGMVDQAVAFVANQLRASWATDAPAQPPESAAAPSPHTPPVTLPGPAASVVPPAPPAESAGQAPPIPPAPAPLPPPAPAVPAPVAPLA
jgi:cutinase